jgi:hypothetical protein
VLKVTLPVLLLAATLAGSAACRFDPNGFDSPFDDAGEVDGDVIDVADAAPDAAELVNDARVVDATLPADASLAPDAMQADAGPPSCPGGYTQLGDEGHAYLYVQSARQWRDAEAECAAAGNHLLVLANGSQELNNRERNLVLTLLPSNNFSRVWIGHSDRTDEGTFRAVTGEVVPNSHVTWLPGEPNDFGNEDCVEMTVNRSNGRSGRLNDAGCNNFTSGYVCECDGIPEDPGAF